MDFVNIGITGLLTYICYDKGLIGLGTNINCPEDNEKEIRTNINQCLLEDNFSQAGNTVINGQFKYHNLCDKPFIVDAKEVTKNANRCNLSNPDLEITRKVFYIGFSQGVKVKNEDFAYAITSKDKDTSIKEIINTKAIQGVLFNDGSYKLWLAESPLLQVWDG